MDHGPAETPPPEPVPGPAPVVLSLKEMGKTPRTWTLTLHPEHLELAEAPGAPPCIIRRDEVMKSAMLMEGTRAFGVQQPCKLIFRLTREDVATLAEWVGKPFLASFYLKRRYLWILPWASLWVFSSLMDLLPAPDGGTALTPKFDAIRFTMGALLLAAWAVSKRRPHPVLFLLDSLWFLWAAVSLTLGVVHGRSTGWLVLVALLAWMSVTGCKHFLRFRGTRILPTT